MSRILTLSDITEGTKKTIPVELKKSIKGTIYLRPLSQAELNEISEIEAEAIGIFETNEKANNRGSRAQQIRNQMETRGKLSVLETTKAQNKAKVKAVYYSLSNDKYDEEITEQDLLSAPSQVINEIYEYVQDISGLKNENLDAEIEQFPEN